MSLEKNGLFSHLLVHHSISGGSIVGIGHLRKKSADDQNGWWAYFSFKIQKHVKKLGEFVHIYWLARLLGPVKLISNQPVSFRNLRSRKKRSGAVRKLRNRPTGWLPCLQIDRWSIRYPGVKLNEHLELEASLGKSDSFMLLYFEWLKRKRLISIACIIQNFTPLGRKDREW